MPGAFFAAYTLLGSLEKQMTVWHILDLFILGLTGCPTIKRLHDCNYGAQWYFLFLGLSLVTLMAPVRFLSFFWMIIFFSILLLPGTKGPNLYGPDPLDHAQ